MPRHFRTSARPALSDIIGVPRKPLPTTGIALRTRWAALQPKLAEHTGRQAGAVYHDTACHADINGHRKRTVPADYGPAVSNG